MLQQFQGTLFHDDSTSDYGLEPLLDLEMSWILRSCANKNEQRLRPNFYHQCRCILNKLLGWEGEKRYQDYDVESVRVRRQWKHIDLVAEIMIDGELFVLALEDKAYTYMSEKQKDGYPKIVREFYGDNTNSRFVVITMFETAEKGFEVLKDLIKGSEWSEVSSMIDLPDWEADNYTESDLFNEFWFAHV